MPQKKGSEGMAITPEVIKNVELSITIFNWAIIGSLAFALLVGFIRGMKKSIFRFITRIVPLLALLLFIDLFAQTILKWQFPSFINIEQGNSVFEIVSFYVAKQFNNGVPLAETSEMYKLVLSLSIGLSRIIVFYIGVAICTFIVTPLLNLIIGIIRKILSRPTYGPDGKRVKPRKNILSRFIGMAIGGAQFVIVFLLVTLPLFGPVSLFLDLKEEVLASANSELSGGQTIQVSENEQNLDQLENAFRVLEEFDRITIRKLLNNLGTTDKPLDALYFGYLTRVKTDHGTINFAYLIDDVKISLQVLNKYKTNGQIDVFDLLLNEKDVLFDLITKHNFLPIFAPALIEYLDANNVLDGTDNDFEALKEIDWDKENEALADLLDSVANLIDVSEMDFKDPLSSLSKPAIDDAMEQLGRSIAKSQLISQMGASFLYDLLSEELIKFGTEEGLDTSVLTALVDFRNMSEDDWTKNFKTISNILRAAYELGIFDGMDNIDFTKQDAVRRLITKPFELTKIQGHETELFDLLLNLTGMNDMLTELGISFDLTNVNWQTEPNNIASVVIALTNLGSLNEFNIEMIFDMLDTEDGKDKVRALFEAIDDSTLFKPVLRSFVETLLSNMEFGETVDLSTVDFDTIDWVNEFIAIKAVKDQAEALNGGIESLTAEVIENLMIDASKGQITTLLVGQMLNDSLPNLFGEHNPMVDGKLVYDYTKQEVLRDNADDLGKLINFANALKDAYSNPTGISLAAKKALGDAIISFDRGAESAPTPVDYYLPAILNYANAPTGITTEGLVNSGKTYTYEGQLIKDFFQALEDNDLIVLGQKENEIETSSYLAKRIYSVWKPNIDL